MSGHAPSDPIWLMQLETTLRRIIKEIERLTQLPSQWNQKVEVISERNRAVGGKTFGCLIRLRADMVNTEHGWLTLIHEAFHSFSTERSPDASLSYPGYEEGVVEQLQRLFRQEILDALSVSLSPDTFVDRDTNCAYTVYTDALEAMREALSQDSKAFYVSLLSTPLEQRWALLRKQAQQSASWSRRDFRRHWREWERVLLGE